MTLVIDASVALKWFLHIGDAERDSDHALTLLEGIGDGSIRIVQPLHFVAEVAAVLARLKPEFAFDDLLDLLEIDFRVIDTPETYVSALELSIRYRHHLFDTLYHAVALQVPGAVLVTADRHYHDRAWRAGRVILLADWTLESGSQTDAP